MMMQHHAAATKAIKPRLDLTWIAAKVAYVSLLLAALTVLWGFDAYRWVRRRLC